MADTKTCSGLLARCCFTLAVNSRVKEDSQEVTALVFRCKAKLDTAFKIDHACDQVSRRTKMLIVLSRWDFRKD